MKQKLKNGCPSCFRALATPVRSKILGLLTDSNEKTAGEIVKEFKLRQPTISYHLSEMEKAGLIKSRLSGRNVYYTLNPGCQLDGGSCLIK
jgi:DNA-binding transcriptional ArsR family regulator